mmetsp:Transcript_24302/g.36858  ORF Transcript_24302/g.36858 Transcript_24302/m.36858 type:complete len:98 (+) Transcript_24302:223-516(+)
MDLAVGTLARSSSTITCATAYSSQIHLLSDFTRCHVFNLRQERTDPDADSDPCSASSSSSSSSWSGPCSTYSRMYLLVLVRLYVVTGLRIASDGIAA